ncbi:MAG: metallophosphoesterase [Chloroflexia bacterium]
MDQPRTIKLLAVADYVEPQLYDNSVKSRVPKIDLLVSCGDLPPYYLDFLITNLDAPLIHVIGNHCCATHDAQGHCLPSEYPGAYNLHGRLSKITTGEGAPPLLVAGLEGSPLYNKGPHQYSELYVAFNLLRLVPGLLLNKMRYGRYLDLLVTHTPPRGIHDNTDIAHQGFTSLLPFIERFKPALLLHGHTHRYDPTLPMRTRYKQTEIINTYGHSTLDLVLQAEARSAGAKGRWAISPLRVSNKSINS